EVTARLGGKRGQRRRLERECARGLPEVRCSVVALRGGALYNLYKYRLFRDLRLVFAPEAEAAFFGGDLDNFEFPRHDLDVAFVRAWQGGGAAATPHFFRWSARGPREGELIFWPRESRSPRTLRQRPSRPHPAAAQRRRADHRAR